MDFRGEKNVYCVLGLIEDVIYEEIKWRYKKFVVKWYLDKNLNNKEEV